MTVTSSRTIVIPFIGYEDTQLAMVITTADQSQKHQPLLWIIHGSGGVSSCDDLWMKAALDRGYTVVWVDHYGPRDIYKMDHRLEDKYHLYHYNLAVDVHLAIRKLQTSTHLLPFVDPALRISMIGFSSGGSAAIYAVTPDFDHSVIKRVGALYPGLWPLTDKATIADGSKISIYVGEDDDWTRADHSTALKSFQPDIRLVVYPNTKHSFSKPGAGGYYPDVHNVSLVPFDVPTPMNELMSFSGRYRQIYDEWAGKYLGATSQYNAESTQLAINDFLGTKVLHDRPV